MSSSPNPNPNPNLWSPYNKDCSQGVCSIYCPQWCYIIFPPPPPSDADVTDLSPLVIAVIGILASACILVSYYAFVSRYCNRRPNDADVAAHSQPPPDSAGLGDDVIKTIAVCKYRKGDGSVEGTDCSVCLGEFREDDALRLLPKCRHAFHLPCIDPWLRSQATCPLCRSHIASSFSPLPVDPVQTVLEIADLEAAEHSGNRGLLRRSVSLDHVRISDILEASDDDDEDIGVENLESGPSRAKSGNLAAMAMKRSTSTGRFTFSRNGKGRSSSSIHP